MNSTLEIQEQRTELRMDLLEAFAGKMMNELGAAVSGALVILGDRLGIYEALAKTGPVSSIGLAQATGLDERYLREWLAAQAASGYIECNPGEGFFWLNPEQAAVFAMPDHPATMIGGFYTMASAYHDEPKVEEAFKTGKGISWADHHNCLFCGVDRFFRAGYAANLVSSWIPSLDGVEAKLKAGAKVADVGCGHGSSTVLMAKAFPNSFFTGFDIHEESIKAARGHAEDAGVSNVRFEVATAKDFPGHDYDLVTVFDALHDMGDPVGASIHIRQALHKNGTWMIVEPMAGDSLAENLNPLGRLYYSVSTMVCTPGSKSQEVGLALGAQAGEKRLRAVIQEGGFTRFRRSTQTMVNMVLEAHP
ncbi:methyltransferase domain-containing protein [Luteolibacter sp. GHJ8]|uniref:Methyltransferase domain-containing protein n=1 Tax=Luteolibacter rhizosphaerae TaxID=2989719 RepID=A0ABT3G0S3_9BACT|nr:class I SAM-dependent methyltransferase [Luteolibacter rhizosphaerae]MCW1913448.1 methyltransferase domain-containing protein [Luteolibacter rhizosphaerae]